MMFDFLLLDGNAPFTIAIMLIFLIGIVEAVALMVGGGVTGAIDHAVADVSGFDLDADADLDVDMDADLDSDHAAIHTPEVDSPGVFVRFLGWLHFGEVPFLIILVLFLLSFGLIGLGLNALVLGLTDSLKSAWIASAVAAGLSLYPTRMMAGWVAKLIPKEESSAIKLTELVGSVGTICTGTASDNLAAETRVTDRYGTDHYVRVKPDDPSQTFVSGTAVRLIRFESGIFRVVLA